LVARALEAGFRLAHDQERDLAKKELWKYLCLIAARNMATLARGLLAGSGIDAHAIAHSVSPTVALLADAMLRAGSLPVAAAALDWSVRRLVQRSDVSGRESSATTVFINMADIFSRVAGSLTMVTPDCASSAGLYLWWHRIGLTLVSLYGRGYQGNAKKSMLAWEAHHPGQTRPERLGSLPAQLAVCPALLLSDVDSSEAVRMKAVLLTACEAAATLFLGSALTHPGTGQAGSVIFPRRRSREEAAAADEREAAEAEEAAAAAAAAASDGSPSVAPAVPAAAGARGSGPRLPRAGASAAGAGCAAAGAGVAALVWSDSQAVAVVEEAAGEGDDSDAAAEEEGEEDGDSAAEEGAEAAGEGEEDGDEVEGPATGASPFDPLALERVH